MWLESRRTVVALFATSSLLFVGCSSGRVVDVKTFCTGYIGASQTGANLRDTSAISVSDVQRQLRATDDEVTDALSHAPSDVKPAVVALARPLHTLRIAADRAATQTALDTAVQRYLRDTRALTTERATVDAWTRRHCGVVPATSEPTSTVPGVASSGSTTS